MLLRGIGFCLVNFTRMLSTTVITTPTIYYHLVRDSRPSSHTPSTQRWQAVLNYYQLRTSFQLDFYATPLSINSQFKDVPVEYSSGIPYLRFILRPSLDFVLSLLLYRIVIIYNLCNTIFSFRYLFYMQM